MPQAARQQRHTNDCSHWLGEDIASAHSIPTAAPLETQWPKLDLTEFRIFLTTPHDHSLCMLIFHLDLENKKDL
jgi:hypothetical protein